MTRRQLSQLFNIIVVVVLVIVLQEKRSSLISTSGQGIKSSIRSAFLSLVLVLAATAGRKAC